jgi:hypothetical protein
MTSTHGMPGHHHWLEAMRSLDMARGCKAFIARNPAKYDVPKAREIIAQHVRQARQLNHASIRLNHAHTSVTLR